MQDTLYNLYFEEKKEIKAIAEILGVTYSHIRKVLSDKYHDLYLEEKASRKNERKIRRKISEKKRTCKSYTDEDKFEFLNKDYKPTLKAEEISQMKEEARNFRESKKKYISDFSFVRWNPSAYKTNEDGVKVFCEEMYGKVTNASLPTRYNPKTWSDKKKKTTSFCEDMYNKVTNTSYKSK